MTLYPELKGVSLEAYNRMIDKLKLKASTEGKLSEAEMIVRPWLRPEDIGFTNPEWYWNMSSASGSAWSTSDISSKTIADNRFVGISGVFDTGAGVIHAIRIAREGATAREWDVAPVRNYLHKAAFADDPVTIDQNTTITISLYMAAASTINNTFGLIGAVVEKRGLLINP